MWFLGFVFFIYFLVLGFFFFSLLNIKSKTNTNINTFKKFSIIVAFRNEEDNLPKLLESFLFLDYPKDCFEIIFINDHSSDYSVQLIQEFVANFSNAQLLTLGEDESGKKAAIQNAIGQAKFEYILTTDADCCVPETWLTSFNQYPNEADALIGSVGIHSTSGFLSTFQYYDFMALQAVGFALASLEKPILCNGANFCYKKTSFIQVKGFQGNEHQPSGDDVFLLQKLVKAKLKIGFILHQNNLVITKASPDLSTFIQQRKRWFYKTKYASSWLQKALGILLLLTNLSVVTLFITSMYKPENLIGLILLLFVKVTIDFFLTFELAKKVKLSFCFTDFLIANLFYPFGIVFFFAYLTNSKIKWKQREYRTF